MVINKYLFLFISRPLLFQTAEDISNNPALGESLPHSLVLHHLFSQGPSDLRSPHEVCFQVLWFYNDIISTANLAPRTRNLTLTITVLPAEPVSCHYIATLLPLFCCCKMRVLFYCPKFHATLLKPNNAFMVAKLLETLCYSYSATVQQRLSEIIGGGGRSPPWPP
jgi:hypothetical protein